MTSLNPPNIFNGVLSSNVFSNSLDLCRLQQVMEDGVISASKNTVLIMPADEALMVCCL